MNARRPAADLPGDPPGSIRDRFVVRLLTWSLLVVLPVHTVGWVVGVYVHEFAHGLTALAVGGYFLGVGMGEVDAVFVVFADAWSDTDHGLVIAAGITISTLVGVALFRLGTRARGTTQRIVIFVFAATFLSDLTYALEGTLAARDSPSDMAQLLVDAPPAVRWACVIVFGLASAGATCAVSMALFRTWERELGALTPLRAFWVALLLGAPIPVMIDAELPLAVLIALPPLLFGGVTTWLILARRREVDAEPTRHLRVPIGAAWAAAVVSAPLYVGLFTGIQLGTYPNPVVMDIRPEAGAVAGRVDSLGVRPRFGGERPVVDTRVFVSRGGRARTIPAPATEILDVAWLAKSDALQVVSDVGLHLVDPSSGRARQIWAPEGVVTFASHGDRGHLVALVEEAGDARGWSVYAYDPARGEGRAFVAPSEPGYPSFEPGPEGHAWLSVGGDLWEISWGSTADDGPEVARHEGRSVAGWFSGSSREDPWFWDGEGWLSGEARVEEAGSLFWGTGSDGFYVIREDDVWERTSGDRSSDSSGAIDVDDVLALAFREGEAWVALRTGDVRPLTADAAGFHVTYPTE